jgi:vacuolar-type H+-ATPase subunit D/Vma8
LASSGRADEKINLAEQFAGIMSVKVPQLIKDIAGRLGEAKRDNAGRLMKIAEMIRA